MDAKREREKESNFRSKSRGTGCGYFYQQLGVSKTKEKTGQSLQATVVPWKGKVRGLRKRLSLGKKNGLQLTANHNKYKLAKPRIGVTLKINLQKKKSNDH